MIDWYTYFDREDGCKKLDPDGVLPELSRVLGWLWYNEQAILYAFWRAQDIIIENSISTRSFDRYLPTVTKILQSPDFQKDMEKFSAVDDLIDNFTSHLSADKRDSLLDQAFITYNAYKDIFEGIQKEDVIQAMIAIMKKKWWDLRR